MVSTWALAPEEQSIHSPPRNRGRAALQRRVSPASRNLLPEPHHRPRVPHLWRPLPKVGFHAPHPLGIQIFNSDHEIHAASYRTARHSKPAPSPMRNLLSDRRCSSKTREGHASLPASSAFGRRSASALRLTMVSTWGFSPRGAIHPQPPAQPWKSGASAPRKLRLNERAFPK